MRWAGSGWLAADRGGEQGDAVGGPHRAVRRVTAVARGSWRRGVCRAGVVDRPVAFPHKLRTVNPDLRLARLDVKLRLTSAELLVISS